MQNNLILHFGVLVKSPKRKVHKINDINNKLSSLSQQTSDITHKLY